VDAIGRHPHADQMNTFMYLLGAFGILSFVLSAILVAGMVHGLLAEQIRQVGVMKAIGASSLQITGLYLGQIGLLSLVALAIGLPPGLIVGGAYAKFSAGILNVDVTDTPFPTAALVAVVVVGVLVPLLISLVPILRASRITVHEALNDAPGPRPFGTRRTERWLSRITWLPRPVMLSVRTTFLRRGRLALTLGTLAMGGAVFMSALNVSGAWNRAVNEDFRMRRYDLTVVLAEAMPTARLDTVLATVPGVSRAEYWPGASAFLFDEHGVPGRTVSLLGPSRGSTLLQLPLTAGRWLGPDDTTGVVINQGIVTGNPSLRVGGTLRLRARGRDFALEIVGIAKELSPHPLIYAPAAAVLDISGKPAGVERAIRIVTDRHDDAGQRAVAAELEREFERREIPVSGITRMLDQRKAILDHLVIVMAVLTMAASVVVFVGAVGLTSTLMLGVIQRTREIGVMSAIGARPRTIAGHIWLEGVLMGVMSWGIAMILAWPVSVLLQSVTGRIFFKAPLDPFVSLGAGAIWLAIVVVLGSLSSLYPAWRASHLTVREALAHA
jgi:putative ABC transport system permease protein